MFELLQGQITADLKKLKDKKFIQSCLCDEKGFIKAEFFVSDNGGINLLLDESSESVLTEELNKFIRFFGLEIAIGSKNVTYKFFSRKDTSDYLQANDDMCFDITIDEVTKDNLLSARDFELNILLLGQFLFTSSDSGKYRPHDLGMNKSHVSFEKGCFRGQEVIARTEHLSKKKKEIIAIHCEDESSIESRKIKTLKEISLSKDVLKLVSFIPN